jgi:hypothetical protein
VSLASLRPPQHLAVTELGDARLHPIQIEPVSTMGDPIASTFGCPNSDSCWRFHPPADRPR